MTKLKYSVHPGRCCLAVLFSVLLLPSYAIAQTGTNPFSGGWTLDQSTSRLTFQSLKEKNGIKSETSSFASYSGVVDEAGIATIRIQLESVDTKVDLRNVRMRFLFFETFKFSEAIVTAIVEKKTMDDLVVQRRMTIPVEFELDLHGVKQKLVAETVLTMFTEDWISLASANPVAIDTGLFNLDEGRAKLEDAAKLKIVPYSPVSFDFIFKRNKAVTGQPVAAAQTASQNNGTQSTVSLSAAALETTGNFSAQECIGRFEILSSAGAIYFRSGSSRLDPESFALLDTVVNIVNRCPSLNVVVAGHTDSVGSSQINLNLSIARADSVMRYMILQGTATDRVTAIGYGESKPVATNDSARNRRRNRRIEFTATGR